MYVNVVNEWTRGDYVRSPNVHEIAWHHYQIAGLRPLLACCARTPWIHWLPAPVQPLKVPKRSAKSFKTYCFVQFLMVSNLESKSILHNFSWFCSRQISSQAFWASLWMQRLRQRLQCHPRQLQRCPLQLREQKQAPNHDITCFKPNLRISWIPKKVKRKEDPETEKNIEKLCTPCMSFDDICMFLVSWCILYCLVER